MTKNNDMASSILPKSWSEATCVAVNNALVRHLARSRERWPGLELGGSGWTAFLVGKLDDDEGTEDPSIQLDALCTEDLSLAYACLGSDTKAFELFEKQYRPLFYKIAGKIKLVDADLEDRYHELLLEFIGETRRLAKYAGRGNLVSWLRVVMTRILLDAARSEARLENKREDEDVEDLRGLAAMQEDPELAVLKQEYQDSFAQAFRSAVQALTARQRHLLRQNIVARVSIDDLGRAYNTHRSSAARWIAEARKELLKRTANNLKEALNISVTEFDSIWRLVQSRIDFNLTSLFGTSISDPEPDQDSLRHSRRISSLD